MFLFCTSYITKLLISFGAVQEKTGLQWLEVALSVLFRCEGERESSREKGRGDDGDGDDRNEVAAENSSIFDPDRERERESSVRRSTDKSIQYPTSHSPLPPPPPPG